MYFNNNKSNTNIDDEFENDNILSKIIQTLNKYKIIIIILIALALIGLMIFLFMNRKITNYLILIGEENITLYQGTDYVEPGFDAYNSKEEDLNNDVIINYDVNTNEVGEYVITYTLGEIIKTRKITIIEKPEAYTSIYLKPVNNSVNVYLKIGEKYEEPGYKVFSSFTEDLTDKVDVTGTIDTSKRGNYELTYSVIDPNGVTITATRLVIVMDTEISLSLNTDEPTNKEVTINIGIVDNYFDYTILPDGSKVTESTHSYKVTENGKYTFKVYNIKGNYKEETIEVKNIDKIAPTGTCTLDQNENGSFITVQASDELGIKQYEYNGKNYTNNIINLSTTINNAKVKIYDKANNIKEITCTVVPKAYISSIEKDGVIITINSKKVSRDIAGYYFSYTNQRPSKDTGGYIATDKESIDVVRLPGTTYVWVEDKVGKISEYKTITISNDALLITNGNDYKILENTSLSIYLKNKGWSLDELNKLIARSVRAAGLYTKEAAATSAVAFQTVLAQKYKIKLPYWWGGKSWDIGADSDWGKYKYKKNEESGKEYFYYGLDCSGFTTWAYVNAGYEVGKDGTNKYPAYFWGWKYKTKTFSKENGEIGDFLANNDHVKLIIGKTDTGFITAEAKGREYGMVINIHSYKKANGYKIEKGELLMETYGKIDSSNYPSGF